MKALFPVYGVRKQVEYEKTWDMETEELTLDFDSHDGIRCRVIMTREEWKQLRGRTERAFHKAKAERYV